MRALIAEHGTWFLSFFTLAVALIAGRKERRAWTIGLIGQAFWAVWVWASGNVGLWPLTIALTVLYGRNYLMWSAEQRPEDATNLGWVVANANGNLFRAWDSGPCWTPFANEALHFSRRVDAEEFCAEDEDAWLILRYAYPVGMIEIEHRRVARVIFPRYGAS